MRKFFLILSFLVSLQSIGQTPMRMLAKKASAITDSDVLDFISRWETAAGSAMPTNDKNAFNTYILGLKSNSLWTKFATGDIAPLYGGTAATCAVTIEGNMTLTFINSPTFSSTGVDWNGTNQYVQTGWIPSVSASATNVHCYYYSGENASAPDRRFMGVLNASRFINSITTAAGNFTGNAYSTSVTVTLAASDKSGGFMLSKESDTKLFIQRNGSTLNVNTTSNTVLQPTLQLYVGALNNAGTASSFTVLQCRLFSAGAGMTEAEATTYNTLTEALQDALGRGVQ